MKKYKVNVNGTEYQVSLELVEGCDISTPAPKAAPTAANNAPSGSGEQVQSPMPGTILSVNVTCGDTVKSGQVLMVLEALKMENEILAPRDGVIKTINVQKGSSVESGTVLCVIG